MKNLFYTCSLLLCCCTLFAQVPINTAGGITTVTFDSNLGGVSSGQFLGHGFTTTPSAGELNSNAFSVTGFSDGSLPFSGSSIGTDGSNDLYRGDVSAAVTTEGVYAYNGTVTNVAAGTPFLGGATAPATGMASGTMALIQPSATEFNTNADLIIRAQNLTGEEIVSINVSADVCVRNDSNNSSSYVLAYSTDNLSYTTLTAVATPEDVIDLGPLGGTLDGVFCANTGDLPITGISIPDDGFLYIRIRGNDVVSTNDGERDEIFFDNIRFSNAVLPVEMSYFRGQATGEANLLTWETYTELNNDYFEVQRSVGGVAFETIAKITGAGTTDTPTSYEYADTESGKALSYYRLRQVDYDGRSSLSEVVSIQRTEQLSPVSIFPNPGTGAFTLDLGQGFDSQTRVEVYTLDGRLVQSLTIDATQIQTLNLHDLESGMYLMTLIDRNRTEQLRFQKL